LAGWQTRGRYDKISQQMSGHDTEKWFELYTSALVELERALVTGRIADARHEVKIRVEKLKALPGLHEEEYQSIEDALFNLRLLEDEESQLAEDDKNRVLKQAFDKLKSIAATIQEPERGDTSP
jgi:hypothetical protein